MDASVSRDLTLLSLGLVVSLAVVVYPSVYCMIASVLAIVLCSGVPSWQILMCYASMASIYLCGLLFCVLWYPYRQKGYASTNDTVMIELVY